MSRNPILTTSELRSDRIEKINEALKPVITNQLNLYVLPMTGITNADIAQADKLAELYQAMADSATKYKDLLKEKKK